jgi:hypothetical protein
MLRTLFIPEYHALRLSVLLAGADHFCHASRRPTSVPLYAVPLYASDCRLLTRAAPLTTPARFLARTARLGTLARFLTRAARLRAGPCWGSVLPKKATLARFQSGQQFFQNGLTGILMMKNSRVQTAHVDCLSKEIFRWDGDGQQRVSSDNSTPINDAYGFIRVHLRIHFKNDQRHPRDMASRRYSDRWQCCFCWPSGGVADAGTLSAAAILARTAPTTTHA